MSEYLETAVDKFIFRVAADRLYSSDGVWVAWLESEGAGRVRMGLTDYVQQLNGDVAFAHVKPAGTRLAAGDEFAEIETIKTTASLVSPVGGAIAEVNPELELSPELINEDPYGRGWLAVVEVSNWEADRVKLLDPQAYLLAIQSQADEELKKE